MNAIKLFQVDAFSERIFGGNPAAVCVLDKWLPSETMQKIAAENFLPETAFFVPAENTGSFDLKWFTPEIEMDLCGHATLAAAHVIFNHLGWEKDVITFNTLSGPLNVSKNQNLISLDFPSRPPQRTLLPLAIEEAFQKKPSETWKSRDYVLVYEHEGEIRDCQPNHALLNQINLDPGGIIITAPGIEVDFVSRFFTPQASVFEDPVTGSAHCTLIPLWANKLAKKQMTALQLSKRRGKLFCEDKNDRVLISGKAVTYSEGVIYI